MLDVRIHYIVWVLLQSSILCRCRCAGQCFFKSGAGQVYWTYQ